MRSDHGLVLVTKDNTDESWHLRGGSVKRMHQNWGCYCLSR